MDKSAKILNALRMGVIPGGQLQTFMVGKEREKAEMAAFLETLAGGGSQVRFFRGAYGSGKTFLIRYLGEMAMSQNYIVANIPIHTGFGFSKLEDIYSNVMNNLSCRFDEGGGSSFESIFDAWLLELRQQGDMNQATKDIFRVISELKDYNSSFSNVLLVYIRAKINHDFETANAAAAWIKGDKNMAHQLKKQLGVKGSIDRSNAMDVFRGFVKLVHAMGFKGIVVTFDEAEFIMHQRVDIRAKAYGNLRQLMDLSGGGELDYCGFVFAGTPEFFDDEEKGVRSYEALYQRIGDLIAGSKTVNNYRQPIIELRPFSREDFNALAGKVVALHQQVSGVAIEVQLDYLVNLAMLESSKQVTDKGLTVRVFTKKLIELLDLLQDNPDLPIFKAMRNRK